jgi:hypothetical protein
LGAGAKLMPDVIVTDQEGLILDPFGTIQAINWAGAEFVYFVISYRPSQAFPDDPGLAKFTVDLSFPDHPQGELTVNMVTDDVVNPAFTSAPFVLTQAVADGNLNALFGLPSGESDPVYMTGFTVVPQDPDPPDPPFFPRIIAGVAIQITDEMRDSSDTFRAVIHYLGSGGPLEGTGRTSEAFAISYASLEIDQTILYGVAGDDVNIASYQAETFDGEFTMEITVNAET